MNTHYIKLTILGAVALVVAGMGVNAALFAPDAVGCMVLGAIAVLMLLVAFRDADRAWIGGEYVIRFRCIWKRVGPSKIDVERYQIRTKHGWALIYLDEKHGTFLCCSDYGDYNYIWSHRGSQTLKQFVSNLDFEYFMKKTRPGYETFSPKASIKMIKEHIAETRYHGWMTKDQARDAWNDLERIDHYQHEQLFLQEIAESEDLMRALGSEFYEFAAHEPDGQSRGFWREIWPEFLKQIAPKAELVKAGDNG